jgi:hypothetical protein
LACASRRASRGAHHRIGVSAASRGIIEKWRHEKSSASARRAAKKRRHIAASWRSAASRHKIMKNQ